MNQSHTETTKPNERYLPPNLPKGGQSAKTWKRRNNQIVSFRKLLLCVNLSLLSRLDESRHKVSLQLITIDYTVKVLFFLTPRTIKISSICCQLLLYWLPGLRFWWLWHFLQARLIGGLPSIFLQIVSLWVCRTSFNISPSQQTGVIVLLPWSVVRSSTVEPLIAARGSYPGQQCVCSSWALKFLQISGYYEICVNLTSLLK